MQVDRECLDYLAKSLCLTGSFLGEPVRLIVMSREQFDGMPGRKFIAFEDAQAKVLGVIIPFPS